MRLNRNNLKSVKWNKVNSSNLEEVYYDTADRTLYIKFRGSGEVYFYKSVLPRTYAGLTSASSKGVYFNSSIRYRHVYGTL